MGASALGLYAFPYKLLDSVFNWLPINQISQIVKPFFIRKYYEENESIIYLERMYNFFLKIYLIIYSIIAFYLVAYQDLIHVYVFKSKYINTQELLIIVLFSFIFRAIAFPAGTVMEIREKVEYLLISKIFAVINIFLVIIVLNYTNLALIGVALATTLSNIMRNLYLFLKIRNTFNIKTYNIDMIKTFAFLFIIGFVVIAVGYFSDNIILRLALPVLLGVISFIIAWRQFQPFNKYERDILNKIISRLPTRFNIISKILVLNS